MGSGAKPTECPHAIQPSAPKLDSTLKAEVPKTCKDADRPLCRMQTLLLDAVGPLSSLLELHNSGRLTVEAAVEATTQALRFLGNSSAKISAERRKRVAGHKDLHPLVEESNRFTSVAPYLFGKDFEKATKEHIDSVKSLLPAPRVRTETVFFDPAAPTTTRLHVGAAPTVEARQRPLSPVCQPEGRWKDNQPARSSGSNNRLLIRDLKIEFVYVFQNLFWSCLY